MIGEKQWVSQKKVKENLSQTAGSTKVSGTRVIAGEVYGKQVEIHEGTREALNQAEINTMLKKQKK